MSTSGLASRRRSSQNLTPLIITRPSVNFLPCQARCPTPQDVEEEAKDLLENFVFQNIRNQRIETPEEIETPEGYKNPLWAKTGRELRLLADRFAATRERGIVKEKADSVDPDQLTWEQFHDLISGVFEGGITKERIVVLFVFCSDMAIRCLRAGASKFRQLMTWCMLFLQEQVCAWVRSHGGWKNVISTSANIFPRAVMYLGAVIVLSFVARKVLGK